MLLRIWAKPTLQVGALLLPETCACFLDPSCQADLNVLGHCLLGPGHVALVDHLLHPLYASVTIVETPCDGLGQSLDLVLLGLLRLLVVETG